MTSDPEHLTLPIERALELAIECWRVRRCASGNPDPAAAALLKRVARSLTEIVEGLGLEILDFAGGAYDPGFVAEVVAVEEDPTLGADQASVAETVTPTLLLRGRVVEPGRVVIRRGALARMNEEVDQ